MAQAGMGSFDFAGASLRDPPASLRMTSQPSIRIKDDRSKKRGAEAPQSEVTEAMFHINRVRAWGKSCPWNGKISW